MIPVLLTPICMRVWQGGALQPTHGEYPAAAAAVADSLSVPLSFAEGDKLLRSFSQLLVSIYGGENCGHIAADRFAVFAADELKRKGLIPGS